MRFVYFLVLAVVGCRLLTGRWPWDFLSLGPPRKQALLRARKLLGVKADASRQDIFEAHRRLLAMVHPDRGGTNAQVHEATAARDLLIAQLPDSH